MRAWAKMNREIVNAAKLKRYYENREEILSRQKQRREQNKDKHRAMALANYHKDIELSRSKQRAYIAEKKSKDQSFTDKLREKHRRWRSENADHVREYSLQSYYRRNREKAQSNLALTIATQTGEVK